MPYIVILIFMMSLLFIPITRLICMNNLENVFSCRYNKHVSKQLTSDLQNFIDYTCLLQLQAALYTAIITCLYMYVYAIV